MKQLLKQQKVRALTAAILAAGMMAGASQTWAATAATSTVRNVVTVNYANAAGTAQTALVAAVDVTINLVAAAGTLSAPVDITTAPGTNAVYAYTLTNGANGIATYNLSTSAPVQANIAGSTASPSVASVTVGATTVTTATTIAAAGTTAITVPRDALADTSVNGIAAGDTVVIGGAVYTVASVVDAQVPASPATGTANMTTTITLNGNGTAQPVTVGTLIAERASFNVTVVPGTMTSTADATIDVTLTATDGTNPSTDATTTTVASVGLSVAKLVRNLTVPVVGSGAGTHCGITAYAGGVSGKAGDVLEYVIVVSKSASSNNATQVRISDPLPPFTNLVAPSMEIDADGDGVGTFAVVNHNADNGDAGETDGSTVYFYPGAGGTDAGVGVGVGTGGSVGASGKICMKFQVTIQ